jgi:hypothetical protein
MGSLKGPEFIRQRRLFRPQPPPGPVQFTSEALDRDDHPERAVREHQHPREGDAHRCQNPVHPRHGSGPRRPFHP